MNCIVGPFSEISRVLVSFNLCTVLVTEAAFECFKKGVERRVYSSKVMEPAIAVAGTS